MEKPEASSFDTSEILARLVASTPLLSESWRFCSHSNAAAPNSFVTEEVGGVTYVAFSGVQSVAGLDPIWGDLVPFLERENGVFSGLCREGEEDEKPPAMVHAGLLHLFQAIYKSQEFLNQMFEIVKRGKPLVLTGHSIGGAIASLSTLWLLSHLQLQSSSFPLSLLCITFASPLLGNKSLSQAILQENWAGNFCHVVCKHDILPRLLFAPLTAIKTSLLHALLRFWHFNMSTSTFFNQLAIQLSEDDKFELFDFVLRCTEKVAREEGTTSLFWPFGNFMFCSDHGAVCIDDGTAVVKMLHLTFALGSPSSSIEDHLKYGNYVGKISSQFFNRRGFMEASEEELPESSYEAGVALALQSLGISTNHESVAGPTKECLKMAKRIGRTPSLNSASLAIDLSKINPLRAQIEWYKASCDECNDQIGYYDSFKLRAASKRDTKVNMNRIRLGQFWDDVIHKLESNQLPRDFHKRAKWVNASQFYKLLVEPLDIAEYYRSGVHRRKGHYIKYGRERRYEIFDRWWKERNGSEEHNSRSDFASLTQDTCFWAKVEEAQEWLENVRSENDPSRLSFLWASIDVFDQYARTLIERKEVSRDVVAKNSSYRKWVEELRALQM